MVSAFDEYQLLRLRQRCDQRLQPGAWTELVTRSADKQLGPGAILQKIESIDAGFFRICGNRGNRDAYANQRANPRVRASGAQPYRGSKGESGKDQRQMKLGIEPVERGANVIHFAPALIVRPLAQSRAAEIKAQDGKAKTIQRLHGVEDDLVVQGPAKQRVRVADNRRVGGILGAAVEQGFKTSCRAVEEERANGRAGVHVVDYRRSSTPYSVRSNSAGDFRRQG